MGSRGFCGVMKDNKTQYSSGSSTSLLHDTIFVCTVQTINLHLELFIVATVYSFVTSVPGARTWLKERFMGKNLQSLQQGVDFIECRYCYSRREMSFSQRGSLEDW